MTDQPSDDRGDEFVVKNPLDVTELDIARVIRKFTREDMHQPVNNAGMGADMVSLRNLQTELDIYEAKEVAYRDEGRTMPRKEQAKIDSLRKTLSFQIDRYNENLETYGEERRDAMSRNAEQDTAFAQLEAARESNMKSAVNRVMQDEGISKFEALQYIQMRISVDGESAEREFLPQYSSIKARIMANLAATDSTEQPTVSPIQAKPSPVQQQARAEFAQTKARVDAALAEGQTPDINDMLRLDELSKYI